jgi:hypothetical protein
VPYVSQTCPLNLTQLPLPHSYSPLQNIIQGEGLEEVVYEDDEKCELLNQYFSFISSLEDANVPLPDIEHKTNNFLRDIVITTDEIVDIIKILNPNKASGTDIIRTKMLKLCPEKIAVPLQIIFVFVNYLL